MVTRAFFPRDEELGKKDDDHKPTRSPTWSALRYPLRWRKRRIVLALVGLCLLYIFIVNIPDLGEENGRRPKTHNPVPKGGKITSSPSDLEPPTGPPPGTRPMKDDEDTPHTYHGRIRFFELGASLHAAANTLGYRYTNRNVLFAVSNLKSASVMLPMACEMAKWNRNYVHLAIMGRDAISLDDLREINGVDKGKCKVHWHDARPDYSEYSSDFRAEASVKAALTHIYNYLHPQVAIIDDSVSEDPFFIRSLRLKAEDQGLPIIEIPKDGSDNFLWMCRLDSGSLRSWHHSTIDILIQAPSQSSGSLIRLLRSIEKGDYKGLKPPRLIVELPPNLDPPTQYYLENLVWPPAAKENPLALSELILRHRIPNERLSQEDASIRFLESFYPTSPENSHVLVLSPQAQLSPMYYHYLKYSLLEYKYSAYGAFDSGNVMGLSLELPTHLLDGTSPLKAPVLTDMNDEKYKTMTGVPSVPFLWQTPNSNAALYFGDKWIELHSFLSARLSAAHRSPPKPPRPKLVSSVFPAWAEYTLELMRARGYALLYPGTLSTESLATIHNELYQLPEEYQVPPSSMDPKGPHSKDGDPPAPKPPPFLTDDHTPPAPVNPESPLLPYARPLHAALPFAADLPEIPHLPYLLHTGTLIAPANVSHEADNFAAAFRVEVGGCAKAVEGKRRKVMPGSARDLFCDGTEDENEWEDKEEGILGGEEAVDAFWGRNSGDAGLSAVSGHASASSAGVGASETASAGETVAATAVVAPVRSTPAPAVEGKVDV
jgi:hypothetical protein